MTTARERFALYNKASGETVPGLVKRRQAELAWWDTPGAATAANVAGPVEPATAPQASDAPQIAASPQTPASAAPTGILGPMLAELGIAPPQQPETADQPAAVKMPASPDLQISYPKLRRVSMPKQALARAAMMRNRSA